MGKVFEVPIIILHNVLDLSLVTPIIYITNIYFKRNVRNCRNVIKLVVVPKIRSLRKKISMNLRLETILSDVSHERKNFFFWEKNLKLEKNNTFDNVFTIEFFLTISLLTKF